MTKSIRQSTIQTLGFGQQIRLPPGIPDNNFGFTISGVPGMMKLMIVGEPFPQKHGHLIVICNFNFMPSIYLRQIIEMKISV